MATSSASRHDDAGLASGANTGRSPALRLQYRSLSGYCYDADVLAIACEQATIDVLIPGEREPLRLSRVPLLAADDGRNGVCFPGHDAE